jgi:hypothetical protein
MDRSRVRNRRIAVVLGAGLGAGTVALLGTVAGACSQAGWINGVHLAGGTTTVTLEAPAAGRLDRAGIVLTAAGSPAAAHGALAFPVSGGLIWSESGWGTVDHAGSLTVTDTDTNRSVSLSNIELDFLPTPAVFVRTSQGTTFQLFDVLLKEQPATGITLTSERGTHRRVDYTGVGLALSSQGAVFLDNALGTHAFSGGEQIGTARVAGRGTLAT